jgi:phage FluMu protein Com
MECFLIKCSKCNLQYLTKFESGEHKCPECGNVDHVLVGDDAMKAMIKQAKEEGTKK